MIDHGKQPLSALADLRSLNEEVECRVEPDEPRYRLTTFALGVFALAVFLTAIGSI